MNNKILSVFVIALTFTWFGVASGFDEKAFDQWIEEMRVKSRVPGVAVSIVEGDKIIYAKGFGKSDLETGTAVDENTLFQLASVSKTFTAAAIGLQVDKGITTWDEEIIRHLPQCTFKEIYTTRYATARDLLSHRTGLPAFGGDLLGKMGYPNEEILFRVRHINPETSFRNRAYYSNVGFFIAGELVKGLSTQSWDEVVRNDLFVPLKMTRSGFAAQLDGENVAKAYAIVNNEIKRIPWDRSGGFEAAGAVTSTALDMGKWMRLFLTGGGTVFKTKTVEEMLRPSIVAEVGFTEAPPIDGHSCYAFGLGWDTYQYRGANIVEKGGALDGVRAIVTLIPEKKVGITILSNLNLTVLPEIIRAKFLEMHLGKSEKDLYAEIEKMGDELPKLFKVEDKLKERIPLPRDISHYVGTFESELYGKFIIKLGDEGLIVEAGPAPFVGKMTHLSNDTFILEWSVINSGQQQVTYTFGPDNQAVQIQTEVLGVFNR